VHPRQPYRRIGVFAGERINPAPEINPNIPKAEFIPIRLCREAALFTGSTTSTLLPRMAAPG